MKKHEFLSEKRAIIDGIDTQILELLKKRVSLAQELGILKKSLNLPIEDQNRMDTIHKKVEKWAKEAQLNPDITGKIWEEIIRLAIFHQKDKGQ